MWVLLPTDFVSNLDRKCSKVKSRNRIGQPSKGTHHFVVMNTALFKLLVSTFGSALCVIAPRLPSTRNQPRHRNRPPPGRVLVRGAGCSEFLPRVRRPIPELLFYPHQLVVSAKVTAQVTAKGGSESGESGKGIQER